MSDTAASLRRKLASARDLQSVVRTMKALAASNIGQYERSVQALVDYSHSVEVGLGALIRANAFIARNPVATRTPRDRTAVVMGSDQGLVGQFNDVVVDCAVKELSSVNGKLAVWAIGGRVNSRLEEAGLSPVLNFEVPNSVRDITVLVGELLRSFEKSIVNSDLYLYYNRCQPGTLFAPESLRLLPLDDSWVKRMLDAKWPTVISPELIGNDTLRIFIREYLFISMFRACAESLRAENSSRLASMQRADKNISELIDTFNGSFNHLRQSQIDEELFDVVSGFENLSKRIQ